MPASLYESYHHLHHNNINNANNNTTTAMDRIATTTDLEDNRAVKLAYELAMLGLDTGLEVGGVGGHHSHHHTLAHLEELKNRKSQNMTECVPVPSSEHVAEIVGRQGCKIKALRAKTNTYIKTPVRGEEPVFVVTGRKEDVGLAKREILSAAEHFSQIRASRKNNINSTLAFGQLVANTPGQTTIQVRVPYRVVGLVVGPKGATIKRIQQQTHTYIVTPSRDKEPVFEVTGLPENVDTARKEIEAHIALRTGAGGSGGGLFDSMDSLEDNSTTAVNNGGGYGSSVFSSSGSSGLSSLLSDSVAVGSSSSSNINNHHHSLLITQYSSNSILNGIHNSSSCNSSSSNNSSTTGLGTNNIIANHLEDLHLHSLIESNNFDTKFNLTNSSSCNNREGTSSNGSNSIGSTLWGCGESHDSGLGHSPPYDSASSLSGLSNGAIWNELGKVLGNLSPSPTDQSGVVGGGSGGLPAIHSAAISKPVAPASTAHRSASIDLGIPLSAGPLAHHHHQPHHHLLSFGMNNDNNGSTINIHDNDRSGGSSSSDGGVGSMAANAATSSLPFTLNGLTSTLATLSASLSTLSECGLEGSSGGGGDLVLGSLSRQRSSGSPPHHHHHLQYHHSNSTANNPAADINSSSSAFCSGSDVNRQSLGSLSRDFLTYPHH